MLTAKELWLACEFACVPKAHVKLDNEDEMKKYLLNGRFSKMTFDQGLFVYRSFAAYITENREGANACAESRRGVVLLAQADALVCSYIDLSCTCGLGARQKRSAFRGLAAWTDADTSLSSVCRINIWSLRPAWGLRSHRKAGTVDDTRVKPGMWGPPCALWLLAEATWTLPISRGFEEIGSFSSIVEDFLGDDVQPFEGHWPKALKWDEARCVAHVTTPVQLGSTAMADCLTARHPLVCSFLESLTEAELMALVDSLDVSMLAKIRDGLAVGQLRRQLLRCIAETLWGRARSELLGPQVVPPHDALTCALAFGNARVKAWLAAVRMKVYLWRVTALFIYIHAVETS